jgi:hypothetical protein
MKKRLSPQQYGDGFRYFAESAVLNIFGKTGMTIKGIDPLAAAVDRFHEAERLCRTTNRRFLHYRTFDFSGRPIFKGLPVHWVFHSARRKIQSWLGPVGGVDVLGGGRHGPGGVVGLKRPATTAYFKFAKDGYTVSTGAYWLAVRAIASNDAWVRALAESQGLVSKDHDFRCVPFETRLRLADSAVTIADFNEVTFVPKDAFTRRSISIEPQMNVFLQLGVGTFLKERLRAAGCDLSDQTRNQDLARIGSVQQDLEDPVTLDLSMASDTMSTELVRELLPSDWFELLDSLRSHRGLYLGKSEKWSKFSSMGNGFTFELESMIFYALAQACADFLGTTQWFTDTFGPGMGYAYVSVFGDDIVVPGTVAPLLTSILRFCGFRLNSEKSFVSGPFRESCGKDFWNGVPVRSFFYKDDLSQVRGLIQLHNGIKWLGEQLGVDMTLSLSLIRAYLPRVVEVHLRGVTPTLSDSHLWCEPDEAHRSALVTWHSNWQHWQFPYVRLIPNIRRGQLHWRYVQFLYLRCGVPPRERDTDFANDALAAHLSRGASAGDVVESGRGRPTISWSAPA